MELTARHSSDKVTGVTFIILLVLLGLSLTATIALALQNRWLATHQKTIVTPMSYQAPFTVSEASGGAAYLQMMALSLLSLRLNVSPETVEAQHQFLLSFVQPGAQTAFSARLNEEARRIRQNAVSSAFYQTSLRVSPAVNQVDIRGVLKTWVGQGQPSAEVRHYRLRLAYEGGVTRIVSFLEVKDAQ